MTTDTFLNQLWIRNQKMVFIGDTTWKMFPVFEREYVNEGAWFSHDFYEGDKNITDALRTELSLDDWKLMVLRK